MPISRFSQFTTRAGVMAAVVSVSISPALAQGQRASRAPVEPALQASYPTDNQMSCDQLTAEITRMEVIMGVSDQAVASAQGGARAAELGASVGVNAALYSGALGRVPGLGLFANAAAGAARRNAEAKAKNEAERKRTAEMRRMLLTGLHGGKSCGAAQPAIAVPVGLPATTTPASVIPPASAPTAAPRSTPPSN